MHVFKLHSFETQCVYEPKVLRQRLGKHFKNIWAAPSDFVSSSIPSWQILTAHAQPLRGARDLAFCLKVPLDSLLVWASSEGSGETARMRRLAWTFAARTGDKYQIRLARPIYFDTIEKFGCVNQMDLISLSTSAVVNHSFIKWFLFGNFIIPVSNILQMINGLI